MNTYGLLKQNTEKNLWYGFVFIEESEDKLHPEKSSLISYSFHEKKDTVSSIIRLKYPNIILKEITDVRNFRNPTI